MEEFKRDGMSMAGVAQQPAEYSSADIVGTANAPLPVKLVKSSVLGQLSFHGLWSYVFDSDHAYYSAVSQFCTIFVGQLSLVIIEVHSGMEKG